jgi:hypothetical protein
VGRTQTDRLLRVLPKPASVSMNQLRLAACIAGQDQVRGGACLEHLLQVVAQHSNLQSKHQAVLLVCKCAVLG